MQNPANGFPARPLGWTADEILHEYLDVTDPTDLATAQAVEVLRWLENIGNLEDEISAESWRNDELEYLDDAICRGYAGKDEILAARWLKGEIKDPVVPLLPLEGSAERWRLVTMERFRSVIGVDILSGGTVARQRQTLEQDIVPGAAESF